MSRLRTHVLPVTFVALVAGIALYVFHDEPSATWLRVVAPAAVVVGQPYTVSVTLAEPRAGEHLDVDLHGRDARKQPLRCVAAGRTQATAANQSDYLFTLILPDRADIASVHAIIYLSKTGRWSDMTQSARSASLRVLRDTPGESDRRMAPLVIYDQKQDPAVIVPNPPAARSTIAGLWLLGAGLAFGAWRQQRTPRDVPALALLCVGLAAWEACAIGTWIESTARALAHAADVYEDRRDFQQFATVAVACLAGAMAAAGLRRRHLSALTLVGIAAYGAVEFAGMLSLHEIDRVLAIQLGPFSLAATLRAAAAGTVLGSLVWSRISPGQPAGPT